MNVETRSGTLGAWRWLLLGVALAGCPSGDDDDAGYDLTVVEIRVRPEMPTVAVGRRIQLVAEAVSEDGLSFDQNTIVQWLSADESILTINEVGIALGVGAGDVVVSVVHPDGPTAEVSVHVIASDVARVEVGPPDQNLLPDETLQLTATAFLLDGTDEDVTDRANWACNNLAAARMDETTPGLVRAVAPGQASVAATFLGVRGAAEIVVDEGDSL